MTIDERIEALVKASEEQRLSIEKLEATATKQSETMDRIQKGLDTVLEGFREFREDRWHINQSLRTLVENVDRLSAIHRNSAARSRERRD